MNHAVASRRDCINALINRPFVRHVDSFKQHLTDRGYSADILDGATCVHLHDEYLDHSSIWGADLAMKKKALGRLDAPDTKMHRFRAPDSHMRFLRML